MRPMNLVRALCGCAWMMGMLPLPAEEYAPRIGQKHPDFILPTITNRAPVSLSQFRGKKVLLIHFASW